LPEGRLLSYDRREMSAKARLVYVEDDATSAFLVKAIVEKEGYAISVVATGKACLDAVAAGGAELCLVDLTLPDGSGLDLLGKLHERHPALPAIVITASGSVDDAIQAMKRGAADYLTKPIDARRMVVSIENALKLAGREEEIVRLKSQIGEAVLVGRSPGLEQARALVRRAAASDATVLVCGESGTGKELVARALHFSSPRAQGPFVDVNSAALAESLLDSELFGHEKGAFTGAVAQRRGKFEQAEGGTVFLDEIGDMPPATQAKILRVLQEKSFQRIGGEEAVKVDVRVVCATNRDLEEAVGKGTFRKDLFYRINTVMIEVPALRDRVGDIPELARHFLERARRREGRSVQGFSSAAIEALCRHTWPGNVRELEHAVERAVLVCDGAEVLPEHLPPAVLRSGPAAPAETPPEEGLIGAVERLERAMIVAALEKSGGVKSRAARALGVTERILSYKMQNLGIEKTP
jgi:DNA-binding NtrC family response regulator